MAEDGEEGNHQGEQGGSEEDPPGEGDAIAEILQVVLHGLYAEWHGDPDSHKCHQQEAFRELPERCPHAGSHHPTDRNPLTLLFGVVDGHGQKAEHRDQRSDHHEADNQQHGVAGAGQRIVQLILDVGGG